MAREHDKCRDFVINTNFNNNEDDISTQTNSTKEITLTLSSPSDSRNTENTFVNGQNNEQQRDIRRDENSFSLKHFLSRDSGSIVSNNSNLSTTGNKCSPGEDINKKTTMNSGIIYKSNNNVDTGTNNLVNDNFSKIGTIPNISNTTTPTYQRSTGARPKVPQATVTTNHYQYPIASTSLSATSLSDMASENTKMKRSPRFPSFDSQSSLAKSTRYNIHAFDCEEDIINDSLSNLYTPSSDSVQFFHRSYSNFDLNGTKAKANIHKSPTRRRIPPQTLKHARIIEDNTVVHTNQIDIHSNDNQNQLLNKNDNLKNNGRPQSELSTVLPDFVQDHWMTQWYSNDMNLDTRPNSSTNNIYTLPTSSNTNEKCQTLPDFLSDGPIMHSSSARLADVAAGLPNIESPEDMSPNTQLKLENDRLRRELDITRLNLAEKTRYSIDLERKLEQDRNNKQTEAAQSTILDLKEQVKRLNSEVDILRRENDTLLGVGAIGGERVSFRNSRSRHLSNQLINAATTAESNLRQLLNGVENLRDIAQEIKNMVGRNSDSNNDTLSEEYLSEEELDYHDRSGHAL